MVKKKAGARMGRPPKLAADKRGIQVCVKLTIAERRRLEAEAKKARLSLAATIMAPWRDRWEKGE